MKKTILILLLISISITSYSQCNCEKIHREDGTTITQCISSPIAHDDKTQVGISAAFNGQNTFITLTVRFKYNAQNVKGDLTILLDDNNLINLEYVNSQLAYIGNSQVSQAVFLASATDISKLWNSKLKTISFKLQDNLLRTYRSTSNSDILIKQFECL